VNATGGHYQTPALAALARRHLELGRMLYQNGSSVDLRGWSQESPLHSAARQGDSGVVQVLLECKMDVNDKYRGDQTPLHLAMEHWSPTPNYFATIRTLLECGADPNARKFDGSTPLHLASSKGAVEAARLLLKYGADAEAVDGDGRTAFQVALEKGYDEVTKCLSTYSTKDIS
jgi:cytohesin